MQFAIEGVMADDDVATQEVECHDCGKLWTDIFKLTGFTEDRGNG